MNDTHSAIMTAMTLDEATWLMDTALGRRPADLAIVNANLVNVYTGEILPNQGVCVSGRWIAYTGEDPRTSIGRETRVIDAAGKTVIPGLIDGHTHISNPCLPSEFLRYVMKGGTTSLIAEMMEPYPVAGIDGAIDFAEALGDQPIKIFTTMPAMVSISHACRGIALDDLRILADRPETVGIGESYWQAVIQSPEVYLPALLETRRRGMVLEGHTAGASTRKLQAYTAMGITSCHEPVKPMEVLERLRLGVNVMLREGGVRKDLEVLAGILETGVDLRRVSVCTDSVAPDDLVSNGYLECVVQKAIDCGFAPMDAIRMATLNVAEHFHLDHLIGGIAPGRYADLVVIPDIRTIQAEWVVSNGRVIAEEGRLLIQPRRHPFSEASLNTIHLPRRMEAADFDVASPAKGPRVRVRAMEMVTDLVTAERHLDMPVADGRIAADPPNDIVKIAAIDRRITPGKTFTGFIKGLHMTHGAVAISAAWDSTDIIVAGANEDDMATAVNRILDLQGGFVICAGGRVVEEISLPVFGYMSLEPIETVAEKLNRMARVIREMGVTFPDPALSFVTLTGAAIPYLRICEEGYVNLKDGLTGGLFPDDSGEGEH